MSMVHLENLFEEDKNFYGLLDPNTKVQVKLHRKDKKYLSKIAKGIFNETIKHKTFTIKELFKIDMINAPEWTLKSTGCLAQYHMVQSEDGGLETIFPFQIDITHWLKTLELDKLNSIADCAFNRWSSHLKGAPHIIYHPQYEIDPFWRDNKRRDESEWNEFFEFLDIKEGREHTIKR